MNFWIETIFLQSLFPAKSNFFQKQFGFQWIAFLPFFKERMEEENRTYNFSPPHPFPLGWGGSYGAEFSVTSERAADSCWGCSSRWRGYWWMCEGLEPSCFPSPTFGDAVFGRLLWARQAGCGGMCLGYRAAEQRHGAQGVDFPLPVGYNWMS